MAWVPEGNLEGVLPSCRWAHSCMCARVWMSECMCVLLQRKVISIHHKEIISHRPLHPLFMSGHKRDVLYMLS